MTVDAYLDPATGDFPDRSRTVVKLELVLQRIGVRLRRGTNEWFLDPSVGLPLVDWAEQRAPDVQAIGSVVRREIETTPGVVRVDDWVVTHDRAARRLRCSGRVVTDDDEVADIVVSNDDAAANAMFLPLFL